MKQNYFLELMVWLSLASSLSGMSNDDDGMDALTAQLNAIRATDPIPVTAQLGAMSTTDPVVHDYGMSLNMYARVCKAQAHYQELFGLCQDDASRHEVELMHSSALASIALLAGPEMSPLKKLEYFAADNKWYDRRKRIVLSMIAADKTPELFACDTYDVLYDALQFQDDAYAQQLRLLGARVSPASASILDNRERHR